MLSSLSYRSRAATAISPADLDELIVRAQVRNHAEAITGLLIYDGRQFFQWLEGPTDGIARVWRSVRDDVRHTGIQILGDAMTPVRYFGGSDLRYLSNERRFPPGHGDPVLPSSVVVQSVDHRSMPSSRATRGRGRERDSASALHRTAAFNRVLQMSVIPRLLARRYSPRTRIACWPVEPRTAELVRLLLASGPDAMPQAFELIEQLGLQTGSVASLCASVFEPACRSLGDLWSADDCTDVDVTLALCRLQMVFRRIGVGRPRHVDPDVAKPAVLVAPLPGEQHMLGAMLDAELLWQAGWDIDCEFPRDDGELETLVQEAWFDAVDLSLSTAFRRDHWMSQMAETISRLRRASLNPDLAVVVSGRLFFEDREVWARIGADACVATALQVVPLIWQVLHTRP